MARFCRGVAVIALASGVGLASLTSSSQALTTNQSGASNSAGPQLGYAGAGDVDPEIDALADMLGVSNSDVVHQLRLQEAMDSVDFPRDRP